MPPSRKKNLAAYVRQIQHSTKELIETSNEKERQFLIKELVWLLTKALREVEDMMPRRLSEIIKSLQK